MTLLELTVAVVVSGVVLLSGAMMLTGLVGRTDQISAASAAATRRGNANLLLSLLVANAQEPTEGRQAVRGDGGQLVLTTWCEAPEGFLARCSVRLFVDQTSDGRALVAEAVSHHRGRSLTSRYVLAAGARRYSMTYLSDAANGGHWAISWHAAIPPEAIGVVTDADTALFPMKGR
jgi:hypothetical protein